MFNEKDAFSLRSCDDKIVRRLIVIVADPIDPMHYELNSVLQVEFCLPHLKETLAFVTVLLDLSTFENGRLSQNSSEDGHFSRKSNMHKFNS